MQETMRQNKWVLLKMVIKMYQKDGPTGVDMNMSASYGGTLETEIHFVICASS